MTDQKDTLLYFLSTVPQVLGALLALIGVFQVLNMDLLRKKVFSIAKQIVDHLKDKEWMLLFEREMLDIEERTLFLKLKNNMEGIRLARIGRDLRDLQYRIDLVNDDTNGLKEDKSLYIAEIFWKSEAIRNWLNFIYLNRKVTKHLFILNGSILFLFIVSFIFVPCIVMSELSYLIIFITGIVLAALSLFTMIYFINNVVSENVAFDLLGYVWINKKWKQFRKNRKSKKKARKAKSK